MSGFIIFAFNTMLHASLKPCANLFPAKSTSVFMGLWFAIGLLVSLPFFGHMLYIDGEFFLTAIPAWKILLSFGKGAILSIGMFLSQKIRKESLSSAAFYAPIALGIAALTNHFFFGEDMKGIQIAAVVGLGILGATFFLYGHAKKLSKTAKICFGLSILTSLYCITSDQVVISASNWYVHVFLYFLGAFLISLTQIKEANDIKVFFTNKHTLISGFIIVASELFLLSTMVAVIPVSIAVFFMNLSLPVIMLLSAKRWNENRWQEQLAYGLLAFGLAMPLIFG